MLSFTIAFLTGNIFLQFLRQLPSPVLLYSFVLVTLVIYFASKRKQIFFLMLACILGFSWSYFSASTLLSWTLPDKIEGQPVNITGYIASLPVNRTHGSSFDFYLEKLNINNAILFPKRLIKLSISSKYHLKNLKPGSKWQFQAKLKRIHGVQNPGGFDMEAWALQHGIRAAGYVLPKSTPQFLSQSYYYPVQQFRVFLKKRIEERLPSSSVSPWLLALMIGDRSLVNPAHWQILRNTGTNHLMAIGGLHIGMLSGFVHFIFSFLWRLSSTLCLLLPARIAGACAALIAACFYSAAAGFSIPTQRACFMLIVLVAALTAKKKTTAWHAWSTALLLVLIINPLTILTESFWLSFGTIALIIYGMHARLAPGGLWWKWGRVQWVIGFGLIPLTLLFFQEASLTSFLANSIAIPWLGFLILPFCFLSTLLVPVAPSLAGFFLFFANLSLTVLWKILTWFAFLPAASFFYAIPQPILFLLAVAGFLILLAPAGFPGRLLGVLWLSPVFFIHLPNPSQGEIWLTQVDVGQGLSTIIRTASHTLIFDTGPKLSVSMDSGENIILPYLHHEHLKQIDMMIVSHGDNDHIGGSESLLKSMPVHAIKTSVPEKFTSALASYCLAGQHWKWDGVDFLFLYPYPDNLNQGNDSSCVLRISNKHKTILLTGDIEKKAEREMLLRNPEALKADILIAPHHGSKTSALKSFVKAVYPRYIVYATGYRNKYHFPHELVIAEYTAIHAKQLDTTPSGAIQFKIHQDQIEVQEYRKQHKHYWYF